MGENFGEFSYLDYLGEKTLALPCAADLNGRYMLSTVIQHIGGGRHKQEYHNYIS